MSDVPDRVNASERIGCAMEKMTVAISLMKHTAVKFKPEGNEPHK